MNKLVIKKIYIFDLKDKKAYYTEFLDGINVITSDEENGNNVGKSLIMKSIYHTLGADCFFAERFDVNSKTFILNFLVNKKEYYMVRFKGLFKIYDNEYNLLFETSTRRELSNKLKDIFDFYVELPNKKTDELEITPPVFMYLLNYIDQDRMEGSKFASFKNLEQYSNFKERVLYNYFGIYNREYYDLEKSISDLEKDISNEKKEKELIESMLKKVDCEIGNYSYPSNDLSLESEIELTKNEYVDIVEKLNTSKNKIINLKNNKAELEMLMNSINKNIKYNDGILKKFKNHKCPVCDSDVDNFDFRYKQYDRNEDYLFLNQSIELDLERVIEELEKERKYYNSISNMLNEYNKKISSINRNIDSVIKHKGYIEMRDKLVVDLNEKQQKILNLEIKLSGEKKKFKKYQELKKEVKQKYVKSIIEYTKKLNLEEIETDKIKDISSSFNGSGSNVPITTIVWYLTLLKIKEEFNPDGIVLPLVLDSPNNRELSKVARKELFDFIFNNYNENSQLIVSTLGFKSNDYAINKSFNIIELKNDAYSLLNNSDYQKYIGDYKKILNIKSIDEIKED